MQRWLSPRWMSSSPRRSALCLSPAGKNLPSLLRTSTKYDPLLRKLGSARSGRHLWVQPRLLTIFSVFRRCHIPVTPPTVVVDKVAGKVVFQTAFNMADCGSGVELSVSRSSDSGMFAMGKHFGGSTVRQFTHSSFFLFCLNITVSIFLIKASYTLIKFDSLWILCLRECTMISFLDSRARKWLSESSALSWGSLVKLFNFPQFFVLFSSILFLLLWVIDKVMCNPAGISRACF